MLAREKPERRNTLKGIARSPHLWAIVISLVLTLALVTLPLTFLRFKSERIVEITIAPISSPGATVICHSAIARVSRGPALFEFCAELFDPEIDKVQLYIRPIRLKASFGQGSWRVQRGSVSGVAELGSSSWPLAEDESYSFRLATADDYDRTLAEGTIVARVSDLAVRSGGALLWIGLLASLIQIFQTTFLIFWHKYPKQNESKSTASR
jgi:hypothetical protein